MPRIEADSLRTFARRLLEAVDTPTEVAAPVAESLVGADLAGHGSHGIHRVPSYAGWVEEGRVDPAEEPAVVRETETTAVVDGRFAFGQVVARRAVSLLAENASDRGVAAVGIRNGAHLGRMGEWAERAAAEGLVFASFVNSQGQGGLVAPPGSAQRRLGTHPVTIGVPTFDALEFPVVLDMATSQVAHGKLTERDAAGEPIPEGWTIDEAGDPVTDPEAFTEGAGALLPLGGEIAGYKGYGLGVIAELVAALLGGGETFGMETDKPWSNGAAFVAVDPTRFLPGDAIEERVAALAAYLHDTERSPDVPDGIAAKGDDEVLLPGEAEHRTRQRYRREGIPLSEGVFGTLVEFAREHDAADAIPDPVD